MISILQIDSNVKQHQQACYLFGSRPLSHVVFWLTYYLTFSFIWMKSDTGLFASFYLEFILLPLRMMAVYTMLYWLIPNFLLLRKFKTFFSAYIILLIVVGSLLRVFEQYFYQALLLNKAGNLLDFASLVRNIMLVNSTVIFVSMLKILQLYFIGQESLINIRAKMKKSVNVNDSILTLKSNRRIHHIPASDILYIESMGNYVSYYLVNEEKIVVYNSLKASLEALPKNFIRLQRSYVVNVQHIRSYNHENVVINDVVLPRGPDIVDLDLQPSN